MIDVANDNHRLTLNHRHMTNPWTLCGADAVFGNNVVSQYQINSATGHHHNKKIDTNDGLENEHDNYAIQK